MNQRGRPKGTPKTGGRKKGTPNVVTASVKSALTAAFAGLGGVPALVEWGKTNPTAFYQCWSRLAPRDVSDAERGSITVHVVRDAAPLPTATARIAVGSADLLLPPSAMPMGSHDAA